LTRPNNPLLPDEIAIFVLADGFGKMDYPKFMTDAYAPREYNNHNYKIIDFSRFWDD